MLAPSISLNLEDMSLTSLKPLVVSFWAPWCRTSQLLQSDLANLGLDALTDVSVLQINVNDQQATALKYKITNMPTLLVFKQGALVERFSGSMSPKILETFLKRVAKSSAAA